MFASLLKCFVVVRSLANMGDSIKETTRSLTVYGFIRSYIQQRYELSYPIPDGVKNVCCDFYGYFYETFKAQQDDMKIEETKDGVNLCMLRANYTWSRAISITNIDLTKDATYKWVFEINQVASASLFIGFISQYIEYGVNDTVEICSLQCHGQTFKGVFRDNQYCDPFVDGDVMKLELCLFNKNDSYIKFYKNDKDLGEAFKNEFDRIDTVCLFIDLMNEGNNVTLLSFELS